MKTIGLYEEGKPMPRIEYRIMIGDEDVTDKVSLLGDEDLNKVLAKFISPNAL